MTGNKSWLKKFRGVVGAVDKAQTLVPPTLEGPIRYPYGAFRFKFSLPKSTPYRVEACTDLRTWIEIGKSVADGEGAEWVDSAAPKFSYRFYRVSSGEVYSTNVVGYAAVTVAPGFSMIANPLEAPDNGVAALFPGCAEGTTLSRFDARLFKLGENEVKEGKWSNPTEQLRPGEGAIFFNPRSDYNVLFFVGNVMQGKFSMPIPTGFSVRSSIVPQPGSLDELGFPVANGDVIHLFDRDRQKYVLHPYDQGKWSAGPPLVGVGESFWVAKSQAANWNREFVIAGRAE